MQETLKELVSHLNVSKLILHRSASSLGDAIDFNNLTTSRAQRSDDVRQLYGKYTSGHGWTGGDCLRKAAGLTQTAVAERLGKPPSYVAKYELGDRRLDVLEYLDVAAAIGFDPSKPLRSLSEE